MCAKRAASSSRKAAKNAKKSDTPEEANEESEASTSTITVLQVTPKTPSPEDEFKKLDVMFAKPVLQDVFLKNTVDKFHLFITNKRQNTEKEWVIMGRDKIHATSALTLSKRAGKALNGGATPIVVSVDKFGLSDDGGIHIDEMSVVKLDCDLRMYIAKKFGMPQIVTAQSTCNKRTLQISIFDLEAGDNPNVELILDLSNVTVKDSRKGKKMILFDGQDETGKISGRVWNQADMFVGVIKSGATVSIKCPKVNPADAEFNGAYTTPFQLVLVPEQTYVKNVKRG